MLVASSRLLGKQKETLKAIGTTRNQMRRSRRETDQNGRSNSEIELHGVFEKLSFCKAMQTKLNEKCCRSRRVHRDTEGPMADGDS
jgi:hypothetical protein